MCAVECPNRIQFQRDVESAAQSDFDFETLKNATFLVTGATGLIGGAVVRTLLAANRLRGLNARVLAPVRDMTRAAQALTGVFDREELTVFPADISRRLELSAPVDFIIHGAGVTASGQFVTRPVETIESALNAAQAVFSLAREKGVRGMVFLSSMEAFGVTDPSLPCVTEKQLGFIDLQSVRSSYSESKRMIECLCTAYAAEYGVNACCARLAQTFGAGVSAREGRVFMQFAKSALRGENLVLHTRGESYGNYVYLSDAVRALLLLLTRAEKGDVYTVSNPAACVPIRELARLTAQTLGGGRVSLEFDIPENALAYGYAPDVRMRLNADKMMALGWTPMIDLEEMIRRLGADILAQGLDA